MERIVLEVHEQGRRERQATDQSWLLYPPTQTKHTTGREDECNQSGVWSLRVVYPWPLRPLAAAALQNILFTPFHPVGPARDRSGPLGTARDGSGRLGTARDGSGRSGRLGTARDGSDGSGPWHKLCLRVIFSGNGPDGLLWCIITADRTKGMGHK